MTNKQFLNVERIRKDFPIFERKVKGNSLIYFDNAATTQKPRQVVEALINFYYNNNANIHRSVHTLSYEATKLYEATRRKVAKFIGAKKPEEIIWVRGATEGLNLIAHSLCLYRLKEKDEILLSVMEHHSNIVPWQKMAKIKNLKIRYVDVNNDGTLNLDDLKSKITERTRVVSITHASNVLGVINPIKEISKIVKLSGAIFVVDGAQSAPHMPLDMKELGVDFFVASAHKMLGPTGIGFVYGKGELLKEIEPFMGGGDMIEKVTLKGATWNEIPWKFEAGTPNIAGVIGLGAAVNYLESLNMEKILEHEMNLRNYCLKKLKDLKGVQVYTPDREDVLGIISFNVQGIHPHDLAGFLDNYGIAVRSGHHCAQPLMTRLGIENALRASFYVYNTTEEIDRMTEAIEKVKKLFKV